LAGCELCDDGSDMNRCEEIPRQFVVARGDSAEIFEAAEAPLNDVAALVGPLVEAMPDNAIGFVRNDDLCAEIGDTGAQSVAVVALVGKKRGHGRRQRQHIGCRGDVGILAWGQMKGDRPAERVAQRVDFRRAPAARAADRLGVLPPFPPEALR